MSKLKGIMMKGMHKIMLDCDQATYLASKNEVEKISCIKRMQLKMHLFSCSLCKNFVNQSKVIDEQLKEINEIDPQNLPIHLTEIQKSTLEETVKSNLE